MRGWLFLLAELLRAQVVVDPSGIVMPMFDAEHRFHEEVSRSRWSANPMEYVDGASSAVLRHPYTIVHAPDGELFVASFTLNHVVRLRWISGKRAQYKIFVKGRELDGPVGMALQGGALFVASFTNDVVLKVNAVDGTLISKIGNEDTLGARRRSRVTRRIIHA
jgi:streptogramin lyase